MAFSGALTLTDLNDFITPSQACIKPVEQVNPTPELLKEKDAGAASTEIFIDSSGGYYEQASSSAIEPKIQKLEQAQISLNDCLACSGCITSAESILITLQSHTEVLNFLGGNNTLDPTDASYKVPVISISPQSLASLSASIASTSSSTTTPLQILRRLRTFCHSSLGFSHVFDTTFARELALREHVKEYKERKAASESEGEDSEGQIPMLASACPGWICYAEKAHHEMLPFISATKSPQQVMGTLVKEWFGKKWGKSPAQIYHVTVMPCYDKKLEASRQDFYNDTYETRDVDCVITTGELELMMREKGFDLSLGVAHELDPSSTYLGIPELLTHQGSSSGSYLYSIITHVQAKTPGSKLEIKTMRNVDYEEYVLSDGDRVVFRGAKCYGFRNLQNVVRKVGREKGLRTGIGAAGKLSGRGVAVKKKTPGYDYVEVMACPGGCVNGGGQLKGAEWSDKEWTRKVEEAYWLDDNSPRAIQTDHLQLNLRTQYRAVESEVVGLAVKW